MKKLLATILLIPSLVFAETLEKALIETYCVDLATLDATLKEFNEVPFIRGESNRDPLGVVPFVFFVNPEKGTWTLVERVARNKYCIIGIGNKFEPVPKEIREELDKSRKGNKL